MKNSRFPSVARAAELYQRLRLEKWIAIATAGAFVTACVLVLLTTQSRVFSLRGTDGWLPGSVADKDFVVERDFQYVDETSTELKRDAQADLVPPVFTLDPVVTSTTLASYDRFTQSILRQVRQEASEDRIFQSVQVDFPDRVTRQDLHLLLNSRLPAASLDRGRGLLDGALGRGVVDLIAHREEAERAGAVELRSMVDGRVQSEQVPLDQVLTTDSLASWADGRVREGALGDAERRVAAFLVVAFAADNAFYDAETTLVHRNRARAEVVPVTEKLSRGQVLVRRGDIISEAASQRIRSLGAYSRTVDLNRVFGSILFLLVVFSAAIYLLTLRSAGPSLRRAQVFLVLGMGLGHILCSALVVRFVALPDWIPAAVVIPTSAMAMLRRHPDLHARRGLLLSRGLPRFAAPDVHGRAGFSLRVSQRHGSDRGRPGGAEAYRPCQGRAAPRPGGCADPGAPRSSHQRRAAAWCWPWWSGDSPTAFSAASSPWASSRSSSFS